MKKALLALAVAGAAVSAQADVSISGHVNYSAGDLEEINGNEGFDVQNNGASGSRFRIVASKEANGITYGTRQELGLTTGGTGALNTRVSQFTIGGSFGQFSLGQGWEAGDDAAEQDKSGTYLLTGSAFDAWDAGGLFNNIDGGRDNRLRYDSPKLGGVAKIAVDLDTNDNVGMAVYLGGKGDGFSWSAGAFAEQKDADDTDEVGGSIAVNIAGFTAAYQTGTKDEDVSVASAKEEYTGVILGYRMGKVSVAVDFANFEQTIAGVELQDNDTTGLSFVYRPTGGVELYAGVRNIDAKIVGINADADAFLVGGRVKF